MKTMIVLAGLLSLFGCALPMSSSNPFENDTITYFSLTKSGGMNPFSGYRYQISTTKDGQVRFLFNEGYPDEKEYTIDDRSVFDSLQQIVEKYKMHTYTGYYQPEFDIMDGQSWHLDISYASKKSISASGYMAGPDGYSAAFSEIRQCLEPWKQRAVEKNEVVSFLYVYGNEQYNLIKKDDHAEMVYDNAESKEHWALERKPEMMEEVGILLNIYRLKTNQTRHSLEDGCTPWSFEVVYGDGTQYRYESYDRDFKCGYTEGIQGLISSWKNDNSPSRMFY